MPRDLEQEKPSPPPVALTESPNSVGTERSDSPNETENSPTSSRGRFVIIPRDQQRQAPTAFHPYTRPLTISDLDSVVALENAAFSNPEERATREKLLYRLSKCGEICYGLFCTVVPGSGTKAVTLETGRPVETGRRKWSHQCFDRSCYFSQDYESTCY